jgi:ABC-type Na+ efflux pump permease subunit
MIIPCLTVPGLSLVYCVAFGAAVPLAVMAVVLAVIFGGFTAAGLVARERERGTLETLLCVPVDRGALLGAKWLAAVWSAAGPLVVAVLLALGCAVSLAFWAGGPPVLAAAGWAAVAVGQTTLAVSLGLWLSVHSATATRAQLWFAGLVIAGWAVVWVGSRLAPGWLWAFTGSFCPPSVVRVLSSRGDGEVMATWHARDAAGLWLGATTQAAVAVVLALLAWRRFAGGKALGV